MKKLNIAAIILIILGVVVFSYPSYAANVAVYNPLTETKPGKSGRIVAGDNSGGAGYSYSFDIPPGRNGLTPSLFLSYSSLNNNADSIFGYGWDMPLGYIVRDPKEGVSTLYSKNYFQINVFGDNKELVPVSLTDTTHGTYGAMVEEYWKYTYNSNNSWTVYDKNGTKYTFGSTVATRQDNSVNKNLVGYWNFNEGSGLIANDVSGNGYTGTLEGVMTSIDWVTGVSGKALNFDNNSDRVRVKDSPGLRLSSALSASAWVKTTGVSVSILNKTAPYNRNGGSTGYALYITSTGEAAFGVANWYGSEAKSVKTVSDNTWHFLIGTYDGRYIRIYVDGVLEGTKDLSIPTEFSPPAGPIATNTADVLMRIPGDSRIFPTQIDEVRIYANALSPYDVSTLYRNPNWSASSDANQTYKWMLEEIRDTNGNYIKFEYYKDQGQIYPKKITYTGNNTTDGPITITFEPFYSGSFTERQDKTTNYKAGFPTTTRYIIDKIKTYVTGEQNGNSVTEYDLNFANGENGKRSVLQSVQRFGRNSSGVLESLPATTFSYIDRVPSWTETPAWRNPESPIRYSDQQSYHDGGVRLADANGDGLLDIIKIYFRSSNSSWEKVVRFNNGNGWSANNTTWANTLPNNAFSNFKSGSRLIDVNGDNKTDILYSNRQVYINTGNGWALSTSWVIPVAFLNETGNDLGVRIFDINGDGLVDVVKGNKIVYLNTGSNWNSFPDPTYAAGVPQLSFAEGASRDNGVRIADVNGDGLPDILQNGTIYLNTGSGFALDISRVSPVSFNRCVPIDGCSDSGYRFMDVNGDGLVDLVKFGASSSDKFVYLNTGSGFESTPSPVWANSLPDFPIGINIKKVDIQIQDVNGDGFDDIMYADEGKSRTFLAGSQPADLLNVATEDEGKTTAFVYKPSTQYTNGGGALENPSLPFIIQTLNQIVENDGLGNQYTTTYKYTGGAYYYSASDIKNKRFAGFNLVQKTDPLGNITKNYFHQGGGVDGASQGEYLDSFAKIGRLYRSEVYNSTNQKQFQAVNKWDLTSLSAGRNFVNLAQTIEFSFDGQSTHKDKAKTFSYDSYGNLSSEIDYGEVVGSDNGTFVDTGSDKITTNISYIANATKYIYAFPYQVAKLDNAGTKISEQRFYYDGLGLGSVDKGNQTKEEKWLGSNGTYVNTQKTYNSYGNVISQTNERGYATTFQYDSKNFYPVSATNAKSQTTNVSYSLVSGKLLSEIDPNSYQKQYVYDAFGRLTQNKVPDLTTPSMLRIQTENIYTDTGMPRKLQTKKYLDASTFVDSYTYFDGFGRKIQTREQAEVSGQFIVRDYVYNGRGELVKEYLPYFASGSAYQSIAANPSISYTYDALGRVLQAQSSVGTTTNSYLPWQVNTTDANNKIKKAYKDAFDRLVKVEEIDGANTYTTQYVYNQLGYLIKITDASGNVRNFVYDSLGRRTQAEDLHAASDTAFGVWNYSYDSAGNLVSRTDAKNQTVNYTYDALDRTLAEDYTGQAGTEETYVYDSGAGNVGYLTSATTSAVTTSYAYNPNANVKTETRAINGGSYVTKFDYDLQGSQTKITYPDNTEISYSYNSAGLLESIQKSQTASALKGFWNFNENGGTILNDASGNGNNGTLMNMEATDWVGGIIGTALDFDGTDDYVSLGYAGVDATVGSFSLWVNMDDWSGTADRNFIGIDVDNNNRILIERYVDRKTYFLYIAGGIQKYVAIDTSAYTGWHHLAMTWSAAASELKAYIDGVQVGTTQTGLGTWAGAISSFLIGKMPRFAIYTDGKIDEVRIYNTALTASEVNYLYSNPGASVGSVIRNFDYEANNLPSKIDFANNITTDNTYDISKLYRLVSKKTHKNSLPGVLGMMLGENADSVDVLDTGTSSSQDGITNFGVVQEEISESIPVNEPVSDNLFGSQNQSGTEPLEQQPIVEQISAPETPIENPTDDKRSSELIEKRTANSKSFSNSDATITTEIHINPIHYKDNNGKWQDIDLDFGDDFDGYKMKANKFDSKIPKKANQARQIGINGKFVSYEPVGATNSPAVLEKEGNKNSVAKYKDAWQSTDLIYKNRWYGVTEEIILKDSSAPTNFSFEIQTSGVNFDLNPIGATTGHEDGILSYKDDSGNLLWQTKKPIAIDANGKTKEVGISLRTKGKNTFVDLSLDIAGLVYPIIIDPTDNFYAGAGDGFAWYIGSTWEYTRGSGVGDLSSIRTRINPEGRAGSQVSIQTLYTIHREWMPFDTSVLPDNASVASAKLYFVPYMKNDESTANNPKITLCKSTRTDPNYIDQFTFGNLNFTELAGPRLDVTDIVLNSYNSISLNPAGLNYINKTGITDFVMLDGQDISNIAPIQPSGIPVVFRSSEYTGTSSDPYLSITTVNLTPTAPSALTTEGLANPTDVTDTTPEFSSVYSDQDITDSAKWYQIQTIRESGSFSTPLWDSGKVELSPTISKGTRSPEISYGGTPLALDWSKYYWRMKFWDDENAEGPWSDGTSWFKMKDDRRQYQEISYAYDAVGNITQISNIGQNNAAGTRDYAYDNLHRLISTNVTGSPIGNYSRTYSYDAIGNMTNASDIGAYSYSQIGKINPHAVTTAGAKNFTYDDNGNITSDGTYIYTWDYDNRLASSSGPGGTYTYSYDHEGNRVKKTNTSASVASDSSGNNNTGTLMNMEPTDWVTGVSGKALDFDGVGDYVDCGNGASLTPTSKLTLSAWVNFTETAGSSAIINKGAANEYLLYKSLTSGNIRFYITTASGQSSTPASAEINDGVWHHLVAVYDKTLGSERLKLYIDGIKVRTADGYNEDITPAAQNLFIGTYNGNSFNGKIDEVRIYNKALTATEISALYQSPTTGQSDPALKGYWKFDDGIGSTTYVNQFYEVSSTGKTTKYVFAGGDNVAIIEKESSLDKTYYVHKDHLGGSSVITDESGNQIEVLDYYPYGLTRVDEKTSSFNDKHKYTGKELDSETGLYYYGQRYYDPTIGRFVSQDPVFLVASFNLADPQSFNAYAYARNNPLRYVDPNGENISLADIASQLSSISSKVQALSLNVQSYVSQKEISVGNTGNNLYQSSGTARFLLDHPYTPAIAGSAPLMIYTGILGVKALIASGAALTTAGTACQEYCPEAEKTVNVGTKLLNPPINNVAARMGHIIGRHGFGTVENNVSIFNEGENITALIRQSTQVSMQLQTSGNFQRVFDVGRNIGIDRVTGQQTSIMSVITNPFYNLVTSFPGKP